MADVFLDPETRSELVETLRETVIGPVEDHKKRARAANYVYGTGGAGLLGAVCWLVFSHGEKLDTISKSLNDMSIQIDRNTRVQKEIEELEDELDELRLHVSTSLSKHDGEAGHDEMLRREAILRRDVDDLKERVKDIEDR